MTRLFVVAGAPGAGKSTVIPELLRLRSQPLVVMDMDELLDDDGRLLGIEIAAPSAAPIWPAYNALWLRITELVRRSGTPMLLLSPAIPAELPEGHWLHLDCPDTVRRRRLADRGWPEQRIVKALEDAAELRKLVPQSVAGESTPEESARRILDWVNE
ncbi:AAA family ATPase [Kribbella sp. CA-293567]|uniref:AAA family ATPase n=1 Tax=Kribbella sp. CA-293567 TaxID=3002436 RepID=UPI0022DD80EC|nr:AAA family ATPase [Kribbella sp. CA-293567]WBQ05760.1 AAA family ATPase [Kribbella sp. CA-293567]